MKNLKPGDVLKAIGKPRTYRVVEKVTPLYIYTRKPNHTPERIAIDKLSQWEKAIF